MLKQIIALGLTAMSVGFAFLSISNTANAEPSGASAAQSMPVGHPAIIQSEPKPGQVLVVMLYDQHCSLWCGKVRPIMKELAQDLGDRVFVDEIDVSKGQEKSAEEKCKQLGILSYYKDIESVPVVMVFDGKRRLAKELNGPKSKELYRGAIEKVLK